MGEHPDVGLVRRALQGSASARDQLVLRLDPVIRASVRVFARGHDGIRVHGTDDVAQQIWLRLFDGDARRLSAFDPARGRSLESFVGMIAKQQLIDLFRKKVLEAEPIHAVPEPVDDAPSPEDQAESRDLARQLRAHLDEILPVRGRLILRYLYDDGRPDAEVAEIMGVSRQVVANWKHKIKKRALEFREKCTHEK